VTGGFRPVRREDGYATIDDYGRATAAVTVVAHLAYGGIVGALAEGL
jgi:hypothetical protein